MTSAAGFQLATLRLLTAWLYMLPLVCLEYCFIFALLSSGYVWLCRARQPLKSLCLWVWVPYIIIYMYITPVHADVLGAARIIQMPRALPDAHSVVECSLNRCTQVRCSLAATVRFIGIVFAALC